MTSPNPFDRQRELRRRSIAVLRYHLDTYEQKYETPSARLAEAFTDDAGTLSETDDYRDWSAIYDAWGEIRSVVDNRLAWAEQHWQAERALDSE
jgi:hypothetical protein